MAGLAVQQASLGRAGLPGNQNVENSDHCATEPKPGRTHGRGRIPEAVRICLGAPKSREAVARGAEKLAGLLKENEWITRPVF